MKAAVIVFPGSNCDRDVKVALAAAMGSDPYMVWHRETGVPKVDLIVLPGGFSYGDYLRCGAMANRSAIMTDIRAKAQKGVPVLGICNGFQILLESGLLPGALMRNAGLRFICRDVWLKPENTATVFTGKYGSDTPIRLPVAHHDGNYFIEAEGHKRLLDNGQIAFRYCAEDGSCTDGANPNGSLDNIAGITDPAGRILGMMPHPERLADPKLGGVDGKPIFESVAEALS